MSDYVRYQYESLEDGSIRLLELLPGDKDDDLKCSIVPAHLDERPLYEAVSYVWGTPEHPASLDCGNGFVSITSNLASALRHLRPKDQSRLLWADQVCINQRHVAERSTQVNMMSKIFKRANCVIMWLGPDEEAQPKAPTAASLIKILAGWTGKKPYYDLPPTDETLAEYNLPPLASPKWDALRSFVSLSYFFRLWILQEIRLAVRHHVLWGETSFVWDTMQTASKFIFDNPYLYIHLDLGIEGLSRIMETSLRAETLLELVQLARRREASDQRDKVFAMLGMLEQVPPQLHADYSTLR